MTLVHRTLGEVLIREICDECELGSKERKLVDRIFVRWESLGGDISKRLEVVNRVMGKNPKRANITIAVSWIAREFLSRSAMVDGGQVS